MFQTVSTQAGLVEQRVPPMADAEVLAVPADDNWQAGFYPNGIGGNVQAILTGPNEHLYVAGEISAAGPVKVKNITEWDGSAWHSLGEPFLADVAALAFSPAGELYASGITYADVNGNDYFVKKWNGTQWTDIGEGFRGKIYALAFDAAGALFAGGEFTQVGSSPVQYIARWSGTAWEAVGSLNGKVQALLLDSTDRMIAGGAFTSAGEAPVSHVARWDGSQWQPLGQGMLNWVASFAMDGYGYVYACDGAIRKWDGSQWTTITPNATYTSSKSFHRLYAQPDGTLFASGGWANYEALIFTNILEKWDGLQWSRVAEMERQGNLAFPLTGDDQGGLYLGGPFELVNDVPAVGIARLMDGDQQWQALVHGGNGLGNVAAALGKDSNDHLYVGGPFRTAGDLVVNGIARWDGSRWHSVGGGVSGGVGTLAVSVTDELYVGGSFTQAGAVPARNIARWDGAQWHALGSGLDRWPNKLLVDTGGMVYAAGEFTQAGDVAVSNIAMWDGAQWSALNGGVDGPVTSMALDAYGHLYVSGSFTHAGGVPVYHLARWDGAQWSAVDPGRAFNGFAITIDPAGHLYAGVEDGGSIYFDPLYRYDGSQWVLVDSIYGGRNNFFVADAAHNVYVTAQNAGWSGGCPDEDVRTRGILKLEYHPEGSHHEVLGSGTGWIDLRGAYVNAIQLGDAGQVFVAGSFLTAGEKPSTYFGWYRPSAASRFRISGQVEKVNASGWIGYMVGVEVSAGPGLTTLTNQCGGYTFADLPPGDYTVTVSVPEYRYTPPSIPVHLSNTDTHLPMITAREIPARAWTVMFYLAGDNNLHNSYDDIKQRLEQAAPAEEVTILALHDSNGSGDTVSYQVQPGGNYTPGVNTWAKGELNMGSPQTLSDFISWSLENYPAQHYALVLDDHGTGLGGGMVDDTSGNDRLTLVEMSSAIAAGLNGKARLDVLVMNACLMGMIEDGYQFRGLADYYVASETLQKTYEEGYTHTLNGIHAASTPLEVAKLFMNEYVREISFFDYTMSVGDLSKMDGLVSAVNDLAQAINANLPGNAADVAHILTQVQRFDANGDHRLDPSPESEDTYIDLYDFARLVKATFPGDAYQSAAQNVMNAVDAYIVAEAHSGKPDSSFTPDFSNSHGVSIYFPGQSSSFYTTANYDFAAGATWNPGLIQQAVDGLQPVDWGPLLVNYIRVAAPDRPDQSEPPAPLAKVNGYVQFLPAVRR